MIVMRSKKQGIFKFLQSVYPLNYPSTVSKTVHPSLHSRNKEASIPYNQALHSTIILQYQNSASGSKKPNSSSIEQTSTPAATENVTPRTNVIQNERERKQKALSNSYTTRYKNM